MSPHTVKAGHRDSSGPATILGAAPGRVGLRVRDLDRAVDFYAGMLGLAVASDAERTVTLRAGDATHAGRELIVLREDPRLASRPHRPTTTGLYHVALLVPDRRALAHSLTHLARTQYPLAGMADHSVSESLYLADPDGNGLEIYADRPRDRWIMRGGRPVVTTDPLDVDNLLATAGPPAPWTGLPSATVIGHVHFTVSDLAAADRFYGATLGLDQTIALPTLTGYAAGGYHHHVNANVWAGVGAPPDDPAVAGLDWWELVVADTISRDATRARAAAGGTRVELDGEALALADPDGTRVVVRILPADASAAVGA
jgi:catechol 2,3-dioxygenase